MDINHFSGAPDSEESLEVGVEEDEDPSSAFRYTSDEISRFIADSSSSKASRESYGDILEKSIEYDLLLFIKEFLQRPDLSLSEFKTLWKLRRIGVIHHCCPER
jgi:hypothetical protein